LIPSRHLGAPYVAGETIVLGQDDLAEEVTRRVEVSAPLPDLAAFLAADSYQPNRCHRLSRRPGNCSTRDPCAGFTVPPWRRSPP
jgi:hypothetical protein